MGRREDLPLLRALLLDDKIEYSLEKIRAALDYCDAKGLAPYINKSGKDSEVLADLVRRVRPSVTAVFVNTGLEYPEVTARAKQTENLIIIKPEMPFRKVIEKYGWPIVTKRQAKYIREVRTSKSAVLIALRPTGMRSNGEYRGMSVISKRHKFLIDAPFKISEQCCDVMKKRPLKKLKGFHFIGTLASDSSQRESAWIEVGCNNWNKNASTPLSIWTEQDILEYIDRFELTVPKCYGALERATNGLLRFTGVAKTGCMFCGFGVHLEPRPNRYEKLQITHPKIYRYIMDRMGMREILKFWGVPYGTPLLPPPCTGERKMIELKFNGLSTEEAAWLLEVGKKIEESRGLDRSHAICKEMVAASREAPPAPVVAPSIASSAGETMGAHIVKTLMPAAPVMPTEEERFRLNAAEQSSVIAGVTEKLTDVQGIFYDPEIHSSSKAVNEDGTWRKKRGVSDVKYQAGIAKQRGGVATPVTPVATPATPVAAPVTPVAAPVTPPPAVLDYPGVIQTLMGASQAGTVTKDQVDAALAVWGVTDYQTLRLDGMINAQTGVPYTQTDKVYIWKYMLHQLGLGGAP